jgi:hypothetical protein
MNDVRARFWVETVLATVTGALLLLTLVWHDWVERIFGVEPDGGDGSLEWLLVGGLLVLSVTSAALARLEWRRSAAVSPGSETG